MFQTEVVEMHAFCYVSVLIRLIAYDKSYNTRYELRVIRDVIRLIRRNVCIKYTYVISGMQSETMLSVYSSSEWGHTQSIITNSPKGLRQNSPRIQPPASSPVVHGPFHCYEHIPLRHL